MISCYFLFFCWKSKVTKKNQQLEWILSAWANSKFYIKCSILYFYLIFFFGQNYNDYLALENILRSCLTDNFIEAFHTTTTTNARGKKDILAWGMFLKMWWTVIFSVKLLCFRILFGERKNEDKIRIDKFDCSIFFVALSFWCLFLFSFVKFFSFLFFENLFSSIYVGIYRRRKIHAQLWNNRTNLREVDYRAILKIAHQFEPNETKNSVCFIFERKQE